MSGDIEITHMTNFCRIFELPVEFPSGFCFGGGIDTIFKMVDWFYPVPQEDLPNNIKPWNEYITLLKDFLKDKNYVKPGMKYVLITDFGEAFIFGKEE